MTCLENDQHNAAPVNLESDREVRFVVDNCKVILKFPSEPKGSAIDDIKRMMLGGISKL